MKTKNKIIVTVFGVLTSSLFFIVTPTAASAGECSASNPCLTYAVLDNAGTVTNIIVCQPSVCGSGTFAGKTVVPQVAATPEGQNQGGYFNPVGSGKEVTHSNGTFTINNDVVATTVDVVVNTTVDAITNTTSTETSTVTVSKSAGNASTFSYEDTVGKTLGDLSFNSLPLSDNVSATVSASEVTAISTKTELTRFEGRKTAQEVSSILTQRNLPLLQSRITRLLMLLDGWVK